MAVDTSIRASIEVLNTPEALAHLAQFRAQLAGLSDAKAAVGVDTSAVRAAQAEVGALESTIQRARSTANITLSTSGAQETIAQLQQVGVTSRALAGEGAKVNLNIAATGGPQTEAELRAIAAAARDATAQGKVTINMSATGAAQVDAQLIAVKEAAAALKDQNISFRIDTTGATEAAAAAKEEAAARKQSVALAKEEAAAVRETALAQREADAAHAEQLNQFKQAGAVGGRSIAGVPLNAAAPLALAAGTFGVAREASSQQTQFSQLQANTTLNNADMSQVAAGIKEIAATGPAPIEQIAAAMRHVTNEGFSVADSIKVVREAEMSAVPTGAALGDVGNALAIVMHDFKIPAEGAAGAMNVLHLAAAQGNVTLEEFAASSAKVWADAGRLGVSLTDAAGAMSSLTRAGYSAPQAATLLDGLMLKIINTTPAARKEIESLAKSMNMPELITDFTQEGLAAKGLPGVLEDIQRATHGNAEEMFKLLPALRGGRGELALTSADGINFRDVLNSLNDTMAGKTNPTLDAWTRAQGLASFQTGEFKNQVKLAAASVGSDFLPPVTAMLTALNAIPDWAKKGAIELGLAAVAIKTVGVAADLVASSAAKLGTLIAGNAAATGADTVATTVNTTAKEANVVATEAEAAVIATQTGAIEAQTVVVDAATASRKAFSASGLIGGLAVAGGLAYGAQQIDQALVASDANPMVDQYKRTFAASGQNPADALKEAQAAQERMTQENKNASFFGVPNPNIPTIGRLFPTGTAGSNTSSDAQIKAQADYIKWLQTQQAAAPSPSPNAANSPVATTAAFIGPKQLTDDEQANLIEHQSLLDQKRAELQAKGAPQHLIDVTTDDGGGNFSKAEVAQGKVDLGEWTKIYDGRLTIAKQAIQSQLVVDKAAAKETADGYMQAAKEVEGAWKSAATATNALDKRLDGTAAVATIAASAEQLREAQKTLAGSGQSTPSFSALVTIAEKFKGITDAENAAKDAYNGYMVTLSQSDKNIQFLDTQKKKMDELVAAAKDAQSKGVATPEQTQLLGSAANIYGNIAESKAKLLANETGDFLGISKNFPDVVKTDDKMRDMVTMAGGGQKMLLDVRTNADAAQAEIKDKLLGSKQAMLTIKSNAEDVQKDLDKAAKDRESNLKVHVAYVDPQGRSVAPPGSSGSSGSPGSPGVPFGGAYANGAAPTSDGYTNSGTQSGAPPGFIAGTTQTPRGDATALLPYAAQIQTSAAEHGVPSWLLAAIVMHESGGTPGRVEEGGGFGRGLTQVDIGQNPSYDEKRLTGTSPDDIKYQLDSGAEILKNFLTVYKNNEGRAIQNYAGPAYQSVAGGGVPAGLTLPDELTRYYKSGVESALYGGSTYVPPAGAQVGGGPNGNGALSPTGSGGVVAEGDGGGGAVDNVRQQIVNQALQSVDTDHLAGLCETFVEETVEAITGKRGATGHREANASQGFRDAQAMGLETKTPQKGDLVYYPNAGDGHVAVYAGDGQQVSTSDRSEQGKEGLVHVENVGASARYIRVPGLPDDPTRGLYAPPANAQTGGGPNGNGSQAAAGGTNGNRSQTAAGATRDITQPGNPAYTPPAAAEKMPLDDPARDPKIVQIYDATKQVRILDGLLRNLDDTGIGRATTAMDKFGQYAKKTYEDIAAGPKGELSQAGVTAVEKFKQREHDYQYEQLGPKATDIQKAQADKRVNEATQTYSDGLRKAEADKTANEATLNFGIAYAATLADIKNKTGNIAADYDKIRATGGPIADNAIQWLGYEQKIVDAQGINKAAKAEITSIDANAATRQDTRAAADRQIAADARTLSRANQDQDIAIAAAARDRSRANEDVDIAIAAAARDRSRTNEDQDIRIAAAARNRSRANENADIALAARTLARNRGIEDANLAAADRFAAKQRAITIDTTTENLAYAGIQRQQQDQQRALQFSQQVQATDLQNKLTDTQKAQQSGVWQRTSAEQVQQATVRGASTNAGAAQAAATLAGMHDRDLAIKDENTKQIDLIQLQIREQAKAANLSSYNLQTETIQKQRDHEKVMANIAAQSQALSFVQQDSGKRQAEAALTLRRGDEDAALRLAAQRRAVTRGLEDDATRLAAQRRIVTRGFEDDATRLAAQRRAVTRGFENDATLLAAQRLAVTRGFEDAATRLSAQRKVEDDADKDRKKALNETITANDKLISGWQKDQAALDSIMNSVTAHINEWGVAASAIGSATGMPNTQQPVPLPGQPDPFVSSPLTGPNAIHRLGSHAAGGTIGSDEAALVGDAPGGMVTPYSEIVTAPGWTVTPISSLPKPQENSGGDTVINMPVTLHAESITDTQIADLTRQFNAKLRELQRSLGSAGNNAMRARGIA